MTDEAAVDADLAALVRDVGPTLRRLAFARMGSWAAAEDVVQDVLSDAHRRWAVIGAYDEPGAWARRAVTPEGLAPHPSWLANRAEHAEAIDGPDGISAFGSRCAPSAHHTER